MKKALLTILCLLVIALLWTINKQLNVFPLNDFVEYWASGRLNNSGGNPYDPSQILKMEQSVGWNESEALMMWNPPWMLLFTMFFGVLSYSISRLIWFLIQIAIIFFCAISLWKLYAGNKRYEWIAPVILFTFGPMLHTLKFGQVTILVLLGCVGFLYFIRSDSDFWAGVLASLVLIKPHLLYLFVIAVVIWALSNHRYRVLLGIASALIVSTFVSWLINPHVISQYFYSIESYPLENWKTATIGTFLRMLFGAEKIYLQFIPSLIGGIWFIVYWIKRHQEWEWLNTLPLLILISAATTSYGWAFDSAVCGWAIIQIATFFDFRKWTFQKIVIISSFLIVSVMNIFLSVSLSWFFWLSSFFLVWYIFSLKYLMIGHKDLLKSEILITN